MRNLLTVMGGSSPEADRTGFKKRVAVRAVVLDQDDRLPLQYTKKYRYHKIPGGGVDAGEGKQAALEREVLEEVGCRIEVLSELGKVVEYRDWIKTVQVSYCYLASVVGVPGRPQLTDYEKGKGLELVWANDIDHAIRLFQQDEVEDHEGTFIKQRDQAVLMAAKDELASHQ